MSVCYNHTREQGNVAYFDFANNNNYMEDERMEACLDVFGNYMGHDGIKTYLDVLHNHIWDDKAQLNAFDDYIYTNGFRA